MKKILMRAAALWLMLVCGESKLCFAQAAREPDEKIIADLMERWIENTESTVDYTDLQEQLEYFNKNKIDLNKADRFVLKQLFWVNDLYIDAILKHRAIFGDFANVYELQSLDVIDERTVYYLSYFVSVEDQLYQDHTPFLQRLQKGKHELWILHDNDFQNRAGYDPALQGQGKSYYLGSPERYVLRYRFNYSNKLSFGYAAEKDMGEPFLQQKKWFDFNSVHFMLRDMGKWKAVAVGDYQVSFGQGLTFGSGMAARKSAYVLNVRRNFQPVRPYRSLNENEFLRGAAVTFSAGKFEVTAFGSHKSISTNYQGNKDSTGSDDGVFTSIRLTGLHRTETELGNKNNVKQAICGSHIAYRDKLLEVGLTAAGVHYDHAFLAGEEPFQLYNFNGKELFSLGMDYGFQLNNTNFFGEISYSGNGGFAGVFGLNKALHQYADLVLLYRDFGRNYQVICNNPFAENSDGRNEHGLYTGLGIKLARKWQLNMYLDVYHSPWLRYLVDAPQHGTDYLAELQYNPNKLSQFYLRFRKEVKNKNLADNTTAVDYTVLNEHKQLRANAQYTLTENWSARSRFEWVGYGDELNRNQQGSLLFQDLIFRTHNKRITISARVATFSIDDYNARVYATEQDVLYQYAVPLYQNSGMRYYIVSHVKLHRKLDLWLKYSQTKYSDISRISSGLEKIDGNTLSDLRVQFRLVL